MEVYLIRHTSVDVEPGTCYGFTDVPVRETFEQEAADTRSQLTGLTFDAVFTSPLTRAAKLAAFCGFPQALRDDRLKEMNMGTWEMKRFDDITDPQLQRWYDNYLHEPTQGGEAFIDLYRRVADFLDELRRQPYRRVALFAHGGVLICARAYAGDLTLADGMKHLTPYGGVERITLSPNPQHV